MNLSESIPNSQVIQKAQEYLYHYLGWKIDLEGAMSAVKIGRVCAELGYEQPDKCFELLDKIQNNPKVIQTFAREFSVGESYFFRDTRFFDHLEHEILPRIIAKNERTLSIWSVGCSRGEELYSVAMVIRNMIPDIDHWNYYFLGTDVNPDGIGQAKKGIYNKWSLRQIPQSYREMFQQEGELYQLSSAILKMAYFQYHNISSDAILPKPPDGDGFDLVLVNNILIYFESQKAKAAVEKLFSAVKEGGWLATTATEYGMGLFSLPHSITVPDSFMIQKSSIWDTQNISSSMELQEPEMADPFKHEQSSDQQTESIQPVPPIENPQIYYHNALLMLDHGEPEKAKVLLRRSLYLDKNMVMPYIVLGNLLKQEGKTEAGIKQIHHAKMLLAKMDPYTEVELADGIRANDLLALLNSIKGGKGE
ncbi:MAG: hypothetical protein PHW64_08315 [Sulfuricurvum sp.]|nr:hypothetical protein [Sulfuricurvum sp.]